MALMAFSPVEVTNGADSQIAESPAELVQYLYDGWWLVGEVTPPLPLSERFAFGPERPTTPRVGVVYIQTPV